jgi:hypothetical protein
MQATLPPISTAAKPNMHVSYHDVGIFKCCNYSYQNRRQNLRIGVKMIGIDILVITILHKSTPRCSNGD